MMPKMLSIEQEELVRKNYNIMKRSILAKQLGITTVQLYKQAQRLGAVDPMYGKAERIRLYQERLAFVLENYGKMKNREMAKALKCKESTIESIITEHINPRGDNPNIYRRSPNSSACWDCSHMICAWFRVDKGLHNYKNLLTPLPGMKAVIREITQQTEPVVVVKECANFAEKDTSRAG